MTVFMNQTVEFQHFSYRYCCIICDDNCAVRVKSDSLEWAAAVASLLRRLYELSAWQPVITSRLSAYIAAVTVSNDIVVPLQLVHVSADMELIIKERRLRWFWHVSRLADGGLLKQVMHWKVNTTK